MRIATITFHWATNYGAVLQAYALQKWLINEGYDTDIIDYQPVTLLKRNIHLLLQNNRSEIEKEREIEKFRKKYLRQTTQCYHKWRKMSELNCQYDCFITGSDQVWNESSLKYAEGRFGKKPMLGYYLGFVKNKKKIAYAVSFGTDNLSQYSKNIIAPELMKFHAISVRENTGKRIINDMGIEAKVVVDPTLLLDAAEYLEIAQQSITGNKYGIFAYILHNQMESAIELIKSIEMYTKEQTFFAETCGIPEWLSRMNQSKYVITNSYHGMVLAIILHKNFIVVPVEGSKMNDRMYTLLEKLNMLDHVMENNNQVRLKEILGNCVNWTSVDEKLICMRIEAEEFLTKSMLE